MIFAETAAVTGDVVTANAAEAEPAGTVTEAGTAALLLLELRVTTNPPVGAGPVRVTVPLEDVPPVTVDGVSESAFNPATAMPKLAFSEAVPRVAVRVAVVAVLTADVATVNVAVLDPTGMDTVAGTTALALLEARVTVTAAPEAGADSVTVPVDGEPPVTDVGETVKVFRVAA